MTRDTKKVEVICQFDEMLAELRETLHKKLDSAMRSGALPDEYLEGDNYLLAKVVFDCWCRDRVFAPLEWDKRAKKEFSNIYKCI